MKLPIICDAPDDAVHVVVLIVAVVVSPIEITTFVVSRNSNCGAMRLVPVDAMHFCCESKIVVPDAVFLFFSPHTHTCEFQRIKVKRKTIKRKQTECDNCN